MLPWLFVVLVLLNAGLFFWGYQREKSLEPPSTPVPEGQYEIRLIGEIPQDSRRAPNADAPDAASAGDSVSADQAGEADDVDSIAPEESVPPGRAAADTTTVAPDEVPTFEAEHNAAEPAAEEPVGDDVSASAADGDAGSAELPAESRPHVQDGLRADELEAEAPAIPVDGGGTRSSAPPVASGPPSEDQVGAMPALPSGDGR